MERSADAVNGLAALGEVAQHPTIERAVAAVREILGMEVAYVTRFERAEQIFEVFDGDDSFGVGQATRLPLEQTYCEHIRHGTLPAVLGDVRAHPVAGRMPVTESADVGAFASVPLTMSDGRFYGTLCCASHGARPELGDRDLQFLHVLARVISDQIEREEQRRLLAELELASASVDALIAAVEARDSYTGDHSRAVVDHAVAVAHRLGMPERSVAEVEHVALLHDIGKIGIPDSILRKSGPLDELEWEVMREHPAVGERIVRSIRGLAHLAPAIRAEHERFDGRGYPDGLAGEEIPLAARIAFVCDAYHAMTSDRPYRAALTHDVAIAELREHAGSQFCARCVDALIATLRESDR